MRITVQNDTYGEIVYDESVWTGKKSLSVGGKSLAKLSKNEFAAEDGCTVRISGNYLLGTRVTIGDATVELSPPVKWYEAALALLPFVFNLVWGNVVTLFAIIPMVGGAIGGLINGLVAVLSLLLMKSVPRPWQKVLIGIGMFCLGFLICFLIGLAIVGAAK